MSSDQVTIAEPSYDAGSNDAHLFDGIQVSDIVPAGKMGRSIARKLKIDATPEEVAQAIFRAAKPPDPSLQETGGPVRIDAASFVSKKDEEHKTRSDQL